MIKRLLLLVSFVVLVLSAQASALPSKEVPVVIPGAFTDPTTVAFGLKLNPRHLLQLDVLLGDLLRLRGLYTAVDSAL